MSEPQTIPLSDALLERKSVQRGIKHAWVTQVIAVHLEHTVQDLEQFARRAGVREHDVERLMAGRELHRVSADTLLRVLIESGVRLDDASGPSHS